ncbi:MAG: phosphatase family protein [Glaciihabitans sp.]|jgi:undecaprenyl-diphosphatase|nr:phosphatase family protein [Glaciihabitans sp.]MCU1535222.1 phosphatase family protein [Glaciihabitans sp.]
MTSAPQRSQSRIRALHEKFIVEERLVSRQARRNLYIWAASLAAVGLTCFFIVLTDVLQKDDLSKIDVPIEHWLNAARTPQLTVVMIALAILFGPIALPIIILVATVLWGFFAKHLWRPLLLAAGTLSGVIVVQLIAHAVQRPRPPLSLMLFGPDTTFSFPSGHVMGASDFLLLTTYLVFSRRESSKAPIVGFIVAAVVIFFASICRVYLGYHWATDALASISLSFVILGSVIAIDTHRTVKVRPEVPTRRNLAGEKA